MKTMPSVFLLWLSFLFSACQPVVETKASKPSQQETISVTPTLLIATNTEAIKITVTSTQELNDCIANDQLPDPDISENYIGWQPGVDFSELYDKENGDGEYMYWETLLNGNTNFIVAGYKRSDNSYMFFVEKFVCRDNSNSRVYEVIEAVRTRKLSAEEDIAPLNFVCIKTGKDGAEEVFAIVNIKSQKAVSAWSIDVDNKDIQETSIERITCLPSGISAPDR